MKKIFSILLLLCVPTLSNANQLMIGSCYLQVPDKFETRSDGTYYEKVDYDKFEYSVKDISSSTMRKDDSFLHGKNMVVFRENDLFAFVYLLSEEGIDIELNAVTTVDAQGLTVTFAGFTLDEFNSFIGNCNYQFVPSSIDDFLKIHREMD